MKETPFSRFEAMAQRLVEGSFNRLFRGAVGRLSLAADLARTVEAHVQDNIIADAYQIRLHPADFDRLRYEQPDIADQLADYVQTLAKQGNFVIPAAPQVRLLADPALRRGKTIFSAHHSKEVKAETTQLRSLKHGQDAIKEALKRVDAYLIISGDQHVPLDKPHISLGRRTDNDIVLEDPMVSRQHAQLRWRFGRFVLYDVSNRRRTRVNGQVITEYALQPGDVINLSNLMLIYGEGRETQTPPRPENVEAETQILPRQQPKEE